MCNNNYMYQKLKITRNAQINVVYILFFFAILFTDDYLEFQGNLKFYIKKNHDWGHCHASKPAHAASFH